MSKRANPLIEISSSTYNVVAQLYNQYTNVLVEKMREALALVAVNKLFYFYKYLSGPGCSKLTTSLVKISNINI